MKILALIVAIICFPLRAMAGGWTRPPCDHVYGGLSCDQQWEDSLQSYLTAQCKGVCIWPDFVVNRSDNSIFVAVDDKGHFVIGDSTNGLVVLPNMNLFNPNQLDGRFTHLGN